jgi:transposase
MLDRDTRLTILQLRAKGLGIRAISRTLKVARKTVRAVIERGEADVSPLDRPSMLDEHIELVRSLHEDCAGNLVRVAEELATRASIEVGYSTLTSFCRRHGIGLKPQVPAGRYHFGPGDEMQHDTSPHAVRVGDVKRKLECASLVLCHSRLLYAQVYLRWSRLECRAFLSEAIQYFGGSARRCMIDNSSVVIAHGTGKSAVPAAAMQALEERFGFQFEAHAVGDANRSGRVERPFHYIEHNFYPGRTFSDLGDLNTQLRAWCDQSNLRLRRHLGAAPRTLWIAERPALRGLPLHVPEVYDLHERRVDVEGYVNLHTNRYSVPLNKNLIGRQLRVRETTDQVRVFDGHALVAEHVKLPFGARQRSTNPEHSAGHRRWARRTPTTEEVDLRAQHEVLARLVDRLKAHYGGQAIRAVRRAHRLFRDYPTEALIEGVRVALEHDLIDLTRVEQVILRNIAGDFFKLPQEAPTDDRRTGPALGAAEAQEAQGDPRPRADARGEQPPELRRLPHSPAERGAPIPAEPLPGPPHPQSPSPREVGSGDLPMEEAAEREAGAD